ncbi:hypothetical protein M513_03759 [Trichuris suis]|uniref:Uncharacterized protein n=1 Tax=Trichuris suis TaxID=68888 RepID=A0A085MDX3_9BILA|nr:hypothetical protein M513_03759 [Trichuris suis]
MAAGQSTEAVINDLSLDERRRERRRLKIRHTNMVKEIDAHIRCSLSRSKLVSLVTELNSLTDLCLQCNDSMRSLITTDDDLEGITKWGENLLSIAAACREPVDHHLLQRADNSKLRRGCALYSRRKALEIELERLKLEHEQAERQRQVQLTHEQERFKEEQEQLALKRQIDVLDEQERSIYEDDELQPPRTRSFSYADTVQHWLSANGARKKVEAPRSNDVLQTTSCAQNDELQPPRTRSFSYADTVQHWLSANGARKKDETSRSNDVLQTTSPPAHRTGFSCPTTSANRSRCSHRCQCSASCRSDSPVPGCKAVYF